MTRALYEVRWLDGHTTYLFNEELALHYGRMPLAKEVGKEVEDDYFVYDFDTKKWEFDCKINPDIMRYHVEYEWDGELGFVERATFTEAVAVAMRMDGKVCAIDNGVTLFMCIFTWGA